MATGLTSNARTELTFECPAFVFNEVFASDGTPRPQWQKFLNAYRNVPQPEFARRNEQADRMLRENGVNYHSATEGGEGARPWRLDLLPMLMLSADWSVIEAALSQRARLLNMVIADIYGPQRLLEEGLLPPEVLFANQEYLRPFCGLGRPDISPMFLYAAELARSANGQWWVMADRSEAPAGPGFALENRIVSSRTMPSAFKQIPVERLASFFVHMQNALRRRAVRNIESPRIVLLSSGPAHPYYFEDVYLARYLGYTMVEGGDLAVRNDTVYLKTLSGLVPVDIVLGRCAESGLDPLELGGYAAHGIPGLLNAIRSGNVTVANTPGCGIVGAPVFMAFLPQICERWLGESLKMPSISTWWCGDANSFSLVTSRFNDLVLKPAFQKSGNEEFIISDLTSEKQKEVRARVEAAPHAWVAQEKISRSGVPVWTQNGIRCGHAAVRAFLVEDEAKWHLMPGGLIRIAPDSGPMQLSVSAGDGSKDLWVIAERKVDPVSLLAPTDQPAELRRTSALFPSRVADNLFWLGRSIDRCDFLGRLIRALSERLVGEGNVDLTEIRFLARALSEQGQLEPGFVVDGMESQLPTLAEALPIAMFDPTEYGGLARTVRDLTRLASLVRDWISPDTWHRINVSAETFRTAQTKDWRDLADVVNVSNSLVGDLASVSGLIADGMNRGPSWRFLELGRCIERAGATARLLLSAEIKRGGASPGTLKTLVEVLDVRMTYRFRYRDNLQRNAVLDLAITDETNPRSLAYQIERLVQHVDRLPGYEARPLRSEEMRLVMDAAHAVRMLTTDDLSAPTPRSVQSALKTVEETMSVLSDTLTRKYLVHSGTPRQITDIAGGSQ
ncbi:MAG: circularly permuted type 2 ATP-grasp protein [Planctomycetales bacterium]|jgi:uncharacterized circularly permuted ATP-grasp superfamily protein/uncharacterized alpha-E superfamily protein|nr:circularly permuted type 2 ATP-grasp protein [Planctomycetales bacterium]